MILQSVAATIIAATDSNKYHVIDSEKEQNVPERSHRVTNKLRDKENR